MGPVVAHRQGGPAATVSYVLKVILNSSKYSHCRPVTSHSSSRLHINAGTEHKTRNTLSSVVPSG